MAGLWACLLYLKFLSYLLCWYPSLLHWCLLYFSHSLCSNRNSLCGHHVCPPVTYCWYLNHFSDCHDNGCRSSLHIFVQHALVSWHTGHKLHTGVYRENVWHFGSKECLSKICVRCHRVHRFQSPSLPLVHIYLIPPVATVTGIGVTWMCQQSTTSCWILTSHQTLSQT